MSREPDKLEDESQSINWVRVLTQNVGTVRFLKEQQRMRRFMNGPESTPYSMRRIRSYESDRLSSACQQSLTPSSITQNAKSVDEGSMIYTHYK